MCVCVGFRCSAKSTRLVLNNQQDPLCCCGFTTVKSYTYTVERKLAWEEMETVLAGGGSSSVHYTDTTIDGAAGKHHSQISNQLIGGLLVFGMCTSFIK